MKGYDGVPHFSNFLRFSLELDPMCVCILEWIYFVWGSLFPTCFVAIMPALAINLSILLFISTMQEEKACWLWKMPPPGSRRHADSRDVEVGTTTKQVRRKTTMMSVSERLLKGMCFINLIAVCRFLETRHISCMQAEIQLRSVFIDLYEYFKC